MYDIFPNPTLLYLGQTPYQYRLGLPAQAETLSNATFSLTVPISGVQGVAPTTCSAFTRHGTASCVFARVSITSIANCVPVALIPKDIPLPCLIKKRAIPLVVPTHPKPIAPTLAKNAYPLPRYALVSFNTPLNFCKRSLFLLSKLILKPYYNGSDSSDGFDGPDGLVILILVCTPSSSIHPSKE